MTNINTILKEKINQFHWESLKNKEKDSLSFEQYKEIKNSPLLNEDTFDKIKNIIFEHHKTYFENIIEKSFENDYKLINHLDEYNDMIFFYYYLVTLNKQNTFYFNTVINHFDGLKNDKLNNEWLIYDLYGSDSPFANSQLMNDIFKNKLNDYIDKSELYKKLEDGNIVDITRISQRFFNELETQFVIIEYQFLKYLSNELYECKKHLIPEYKELFLMNNKC